MARESRDQRLAREMREQHGDFESASERNARRGRGTPPKPRVTGRTSAVQSEGSSGLTGADVDAAYDAVHGTPASAARRASARSPKGIERWRKSVNPRWNG